MTTNTIKVRYIGLKAKCTDSFPSGSIHTWFGAGDVQELPAAALSKVLQHPTVWEVVADEPHAPAGLAAAASGQQPPADEAPPADDKPADPWLTKTAEELHAYCVERGIRVDKRLKDADKIRAAIDAATPASAD